MVGRLKGAVLPPVQVHGDGAVQDIHVGGVNTEIGKRLCLRGGQAGGDGEGNRGGRQDGQPAFVSFHRAALLSGYLITAHYT